MTPTERPPCSARSTALYEAVIYQHFLDNIEPDEHRYHAGDPLAALKHAADLAG